MATNTTAPEPTKTVSVVDIKSTWASKINWTQTVGLAASFLVLFGVNLPPETQVHIVVVIQAIIAVATWILKTFFSNTITPSSATNTEVVLK
jgi:hypothetical protein